MKRPTITIPRLVARRSRRDEAWQVDVAEQRAEDHAMATRVEELMAQATQPGVDQVALTLQVFHQFEAWYFAFSARHNRRLAAINAAYGVRRVAAVGLIVALAVIVCSTVGLGLVAISASQRATAASQNAAAVSRRAALLARQNHRLGLQIQAERTRSNIETCREDNRKYDKSVKYIMALSVKQLGAHPTKTARALEKVAVAEFDTLINDLAPKHQDCKVYALRRVHPN